jgi:hypothetical protein
MAVSEGAPAAKLVRERAAAAVAYAVVALGFYLMSLFLPHFMSGVRIPGLPDPVARLDWLLWAFLFLLAFAFAATAIYDAMRAIDPLFALLSRRFGRAAGSGKRVARDLAYALLAALTAVALAPLTEPLGPAAPLARAVLGVGALLVLVLLLYDAAKTIYAYVREKVEETVSKLAR